MPASDDFNAMREVTRSDVQALRKTMRKLGVLIAEVDRELRYVWIDNPHPDFDAAKVIGKRDDELISKADATELMELKRVVLRSEEPLSRTICFKRSDGLRRYNVSAYPVRGAKGKIEGVISFAFETETSRGRR